MKLLDRRLRRKVEETVGDAQFGFRKKTLGTRNATTMPRTVMERIVEKQKDLYMCLVDFEKAIDMVRHKLLITRLVKLGVDAMYLRLLVI